MSKTVGAAVEVNIKQSYPSIVHKSSTRSHSHRAISPTHHERRGPVSLQQHLLFEFFRKEVKPVFDCVALRNLVHPGLVLVVFVLFARVVASKVGFSVDRHHRFATVVDSRVRAIDPATIIVMLICIALIHIHVRVYVTISCLVALLLSNHVKVQVLLASSLRCTHAQHLGVIFLSHAEILIKHAAVAASKGNISITLVQSV